MDIRAPKPKRVNSNQATIPLGVFRDHVEPAVVQARNVWVRSVEVQVGGNYPILAGDQYFCQCSQSCTIDRGVRYRVTRVVFS